MEKSDYKIYIIGAGISGLVAARVLEEHGYAPVIYEASDSVGGRVKTDVIDGYQLDHGFQVLLDAYPMAKKYLDYDGLSLQKFLPGAVIFNQGRSHTIGDPLRSLSFLIPTLFSRIGSFSDKIKIFRLNRELKHRTLERIFSSAETTTEAYLKSKGFSDKIITSFFKPFFSGIFLEPNLETSSRMFQFVYKMFGEGLAVIPKSGIAAISQQLTASLKSTKIVFNTKVAAVAEGKIVLNDGTELDNHFAIIATEASALVSNLNNQEVAWKGCDTLYFTCKKRKIDQPLIGLLADEGLLTNNFYFPTSLKTVSKGSDELLCVTVVKEHSLNSEALRERVENELKESKVMLVL